MMQTPGRRRLARYAVIVVAGYATDLLVALMLVRIAGFGLVAAAAAGFATGLILNYILFELWVFRTETPGSLSWRRLGGTVASALVALSVRLLVVALLSRAVAGSADFAAAIFLAAAGASAVVNFALVRLLFRRSATAAPERAP